MPQRTTVDAVTKICPTEIPDIQGPMRSGSLIVDRIYGDLVDETTELIERYLVAHFVALLDPREISASSAVGGLSVRYEGRMTSEGMTTYLKQAMQLDTTGELAKVMQEVKQATLEVW